MNNCFGFTSEVANSIIVMFFETRECLYKKKCTTDSDILVFVYFLQLTKRDITNKLLFSPTNLTQKEMKL